MTDHLIKFSKDNVPLQNRIHCLFMLMFNRSDFGKSVNNDIMSKFLDSRYLLDVVIPGLLSSEDPSNYSQLPINKPQDVNPICEALIIVNQI